MWCGTHHIAIRGFTNYELRCEVRARRRWYREDAGTACTICGGIAPRTSNICSEQNRTSLNSSKLFYFSYYIIQILIIFFLLQNDVGMNEREKRKMKETMLRCHCETNTQHDPSMRVTDSGVGASETVRASASDRESSVGVRARVSSTIRRCE